MHIATAVGTRVVALFGAADPARTGPVGQGHRVIQAGDVPCVPCRSRTCSDSVYLECMKKISPKDVFTAIADMLKSTKQV
jgi:ADP-heptose:LPS heptosyltransferase